MPIIQDQPPYCSVVPPVEMPFRSGSAAGPGSGRSPEASPPFAYR